MAELKRVYNVPLRKEWSKAPSWKRAKKAVTALQTFVAKHMKTDYANVKVGRFANMKIWEQGCKRPPHHLKVEVIKYDDNRVTVELEGKQFEVIRKEETEEKGKIQQMVEKVAGKKIASKIEDSPKEEVKPVKEETEKKIKDTTPAKEDTKKENPSDTIIEKEESKKERTPRKTSSLVEKKETPIVGTPDQLKS